MSSVAVKDQGAAEFVRRVKALRGQRVRVGILADTPKRDKDGGGGRASLLEVAAVHEFGASIPVTPRMRRYLASQGLHLRASTTHITIPARSYIRSTADVRGAEISDLQAGLVRQCLEGDLDPESVGELLGAKVVAWVQAAISGNIPPPLHPFTAQRKNSTTALVDTGQLRSSVTWTAEGGGA